jgi:hypothetical protein
MFITGIISTIQKNILTIILQVSLIRIIPSN